MDILETIEKIFYFATFCIVYVHSEDRFICFDHDYVPLHGDRKPPPGNLYYGDEAVLRYSCDESYTLYPNISIQTCTEGQWLPSQPPSCVLSTTTAIAKVTTESTTQVNCSSPPHIENGIALCCSQGTNFCCLANGKAQIECNPGYTMQLNNGQSELTCSNQGVWANSSSLQCVKDSASPTPQLEESPFSDGMIRTVAGVAAGVFSLLLLVIALAFCKPRLKEIKRRWRDFREDENGLIVNGQRVILPSYEEATSNNHVQTWGDDYDRIPPTRRLNSLSANVLSSPADVTRPPESNVTVDDIMVLPIGNTCDTLVELNHPRDCDPCSSGDVERSCDFQTSSSRVQSLPSRDDLTVTEFLCETPCSSRDFDDVPRFEDDFVPISAYSGGQGADCSSPSLSLSSTEGVLAPLLAAPTVSTRTPDVTIKQIKQFAHPLGGVENQALQFVPTDPPQPGADVSDNPIDKSINDSINRLGQFTVGGAIEPNDDITGHIELCEDNSLHTDSTTV